MHSWKGLLITSVIVIVGIVANEKGLLSAVGGKAATATK